MTGGDLGAAIERVDADLRALLGSRELLPAGPLPRVTLGLTATNPEPFHVFTWPTARNFAVAGVLSGGVVEMTFHIWVTLVASGSDMESACETANRYLTTAMMVPLVDTELGGTVVEVGMPQVERSESWSDPDGRCHAGYLLDFEASACIAADQAARKIIKEMGNE